MIQLYDIDIDLPTIPFLSRLLLSGYDYSVDLWAYGILLFEMYEDQGPFGPDDVEETQLFTAITSHRLVCIARSDTASFISTDLL